VGPRVHDGKGGEHWTTGKKMEKRTESRGEKAERSKIPLRESGYQRPEEDLEEAGSQRGPCSSKSRGWKLLKTVN